MKIGDLGLVGLVAGLNRQASRRLPSRTEPNSSDDYYWQQLSNLQKSALSFKQSSSMPFKTTTCLNEPPRHKNYPGQTNYSTYSQWILSLQKTVHLKLDPLLATNPGPKIQNTGMKPKGLAITPIEAKQPQSITVLNTSPSLQKTPWLLYLSQEFKKHYLFIDQKTLELAVNTGAFTQSESKELCIYIQQALQQYPIKTLIFNGVLL